MVDECDCKLTHFKKDNGELTEYNGGINFTEYEPENCIAHNVLTHFESIPTASKIQSLQRPKTDNKLFEETERVFFQKLKCIIE